MNASTRESGGYGARKEYPPQTVQGHGFMVDDLQWDRIKRRVGQIEGAPAPEWLLTLASMAFAIGVSAWIALLVLPHATTDSTHLATGVRPALIASGASGVILGLILAAVYRYERGRQSGKKGDLQDEMDTIRKTWRDQAEQATEAPG